MSLDAGLVRRLIAAQFPQWADLTVKKVEPGGWDNRTFRLGEAMSVRLPSAARYAAQVEKEQAWLPRLAAQLPLPIPAPVAMGRPGQGYDWPWSVCCWIEGTPVADGGAGDLIPTYRLSAREAFVLAAVVGGLFALIALMPRFNGRWDDD